MGTKNTDFIERMNEIKIINVYKFYHELQSNTNNHENCWHSGSNIYKGLDKMLKYDHSNTIS